MITIERETLQAAIDALEESVDTVQNDYDSDWRHGMPTRKAQLDASLLALNQHRAAIDELRAALAAQPADCGNTPYDEGPFTLAQPAEPVACESCEELQHLCDRLADLLTRTAAALKGSPPPLTLHDWSDLPDVASDVADVARLKPYAAPPVPAAVPLTSQRDIEENAFESWLVRVCPSGDVEDVHRQWLASSDYEDCQPAPTAVPLTGAQLDRLYANSPEYHKDVKSAEAFKRIVQFTEQIHRISAGGAA